VAGDPGSSSLSFQVLPLRITFPFPSICLVFLPNRIHGKSVSDPLRDTLTSLPVWTTRLVCRSEGCTRKGVADRDSFLIFYLDPEVTPCFRAFIPRLRIPLLRISRGTESFAPLHQSAFPFRGNLNFFIPEPKNVFHPSPPPVYRISARVYLPLLCVHFDDHLHASTGLRCAVAPTAPLPPDERQRFFLGDVLGPESGTSTPPHSPGSPLSSILLDPPPAFLFRTKPSTSTLEYDRTPS